MFTFRKPLISLMLIFLALSGCVSTKGILPTYPVIKNMTPTDTFTPNFSPTGQIEVSATYVATPTDAFPFFSVLNAGDYILYYQHGLYALSATSSISEKYTDLDGIPVSSDVSLIMAGSKIYDSYTHSILDTAYYSNFFDCAVYSSSPDHKEFVGKCRDGNLYVIPTDKSKSNVLINIRESTNDRFENPIWSPDGKWISYIRTIPDPNFQSSVGISQLFLVDTTCLQNPETCSQNQQGPINGNFFTGLSPYSWSPDSRGIAFPSGSFNSILIYDLQSRLIREIPWSTGVYSVSWSPDGRSLAFSGLSTINQRYIQIYLLPVSGGKPIQLTSGPVDKKLIYWIRVP